MQLEQALQPHAVTEETARPKRDILTPALLAAGGVLTVVWTGFLGWGAVSLASYLLG
ncbi:hypothetical protein OCOJLMKI_2232 [Methylobacterium iners]|uniref:Uncharacterized protein n=1 Tax=Methylobacterium iners TaxID=418707 RepID=A0ABQ4RXU8_9HYPH|nr:hypothetical protein OCOJLMKI_2232 [Methylobacterium iners]